MLLAGVASGRRWASEWRPRADGPFIEVTEWLAGFYLLDCADADEALDWARRLPLLVGEAVDVAPAGVPHP